MDSMMSTAIDGLNWYDLYRPAEPMLTEEERWTSTTVGGVEKKYKRGYTMAEYTPWLKNLPGSNQLLGTYLTDYLNNESVRAALHIPSKMPVWSMCSGEVGNLY